MTQATLLSLSTFAVVHRLFCLPQQQHHLPLHNQVVADSCLVVVIERKTTGKMAKWFRSEPMEYISLIMNEDAAHDCLADLGKLGVIQFTDVRCR